MRMVWVRCMIGAGILSVVLLAACKIASATGVIASQFHERESVWVKAVTRTRKESHE